MTMLESGSESPASDKDEGYGRESPVHCVRNSTALILVRQKCARHLEQQIERIKHLPDSDSSCPILRRLLSNTKSGTISSDDYYKAVCRETLDEFGKLVKLLNQLDESQKVNNNNMNFEVSFVFYLLS